MLSEKEIDYNTEIRLTYKRSIPARRSARISDVARAAGVSVATVSRAVSAPEKLSEGTRRRVLAAIDELGYTPNTLARQLRVGSSRMILVVVPRRSNPPFFSEVLRGVDVTLVEAGYVLITGYMEGEDRDLRLIELATSGHLAGLMTTSGKLPQVNGRSILDGGLPAVALCADPGVKGMPAVLIDDEAAARSQARHLLELGHRRIFYVTGPAGNYNETARHRGIVAELTAAGLYPEALVECPGDYVFEAGHRGAEAYLALADRPSAVICSNDECAVAFMKTIRSAGLTIPGDLSLIGFDGIEFADYCEPALTTIAQPRFELGATAAKLLVEMISGVPPSVDLDAQNRSFLDVDLKVRGSTAAPPAGQRD
ncbi:transcriptional regulator, LacI family [Consotaella salsifontis]|uniref:Transcriptional regulator, LacI family n=1 Tax=Consotaella salsifontis TaxID=1365950 RepID=A0A1T4MPC7_9HYPH|nr:transcriptional regulator, LacI family [Consotaella salsifontis]